MANPALVKAFLNAIGDKESGGDYNAYNGDGNARGKYQFQPATYESAAQAAGLDGSDWSPENQENVAFHYANDVLDQNNGDVRRAASVWYSGDPNLADDESSQGEYPTIKAYADDIAKRIADGGTGFDFTAKDAKGNPFFSMRANVRTSDTKEPLDQASIASILGKSGPSKADDQYQRFLYGPHYDQEALRYGSDVGKRMKPFLDSLQATYNAKKDSDIDAANAVIKKQQIMGMLGLIRNSNNVDNRRAYADLAKNLLGASLNDGADQFVTGGQLLDSQIKMNNDERNFNEKKREFDSTMAMKQKELELAQQKAANASSGGGGGGSRSGGGSGIGNTELELMKMSDNYAANHPGEYNPYERAANAVMDKINYTTGVAAQSDPSTYEGGMSLATQILEANAALAGKPGWRSADEIMPMVDGVLAQSGNSITDHQRQTMLGTYF